MYEASNDFKKNTNFRSPKLWRKPIKKIKPKFPIAHHEEAQEKKGRIY